MAKLELESVTAIVAQLENRAGNLQRLCGEILATLHVNRNRGLLSSANDQMLDDMIVGWRKELQRWSYHEN